MLHHSTSDRERPPTGTRVTHASVQHHSTSDRERPPTGTRVTHERARTDTKTHSRTSHSCARRARRFNHCRAATQTQPHADCAASAPARNTRPAKRAPTYPRGQRHTHPPPSTTVKDGPIEIHINAKGVDGPSTVSPTATNDAAVAAIKHATYGRAGTPVDHMHFVNPRHWPYTWTAAECGDRPDGREPKAMVGDTAPFLSNPEPHLTYSFPARDAKDLIFVRTSILSRWQRGFIQSFLMRRPGATILDRYEATSIGINYSDLSSFRPRSDRMEKSYQIFIRCHRGTNLALDVTLDSRVSDIMLRVSHQVHVPAHAQRLTYAGKSLQGDLTLRDYNVQRDSTIHLSLRLAGGGGSHHSEDLTTEIEETDVTIRPGDRFAMVMNEMVSLARLNKISAYLVIGGAKTALTAGTDVPPMVTDTLIQTACRAAIPLEFGWYNHEKACAEEDRDRTPDPSMILTDRSDAKAFNTSLCGLPGRISLPISGSALRELADLLGRPEFLDFIPDADLTPPGSKGRRCAVPPLNAYLTEATGNISCATPGSRPDDTPARLTGTGSRSPGLTGAANAQRLLTPGGAHDELKGQLEEISDRIRSTEEGIGTLQERRDPRLEHDPAEEALNTDAETYAGDPDATSPDDAVAAVLRLAVSSHLQAAAWDVRRGHMSNGGLAKAHRPDHFSEVEGAFLILGEDERRANTIIDTLADPAVFNCDDLEEEVTAWVDAQRDEPNSNLSHFLEYFHMPPTISATLSGSTRKGIDHARSYIEEAYALVGPKIRPLLDDLIVEADSYSCTRTDDELRGVASAAIPPGGLAAVKTLWDRLRDTPYDLWVQGQTEVVMATEPGQQPKVDHAATANRELVRDLAERYRSRLMKPMYMRTVHTAIAICVTFMKAATYDQKLRTQERAQRAHARVAEDAERRQTLTRLQRELADQQKLHDKIKARLIEATLLNPPASPVDGSTTLDGLSSRGSTTSSSGTDRKHKFREFATLNLQLENCRHLAYRIGKHPKIRGTGPVVPLDCLPPELPYILRDIMVQYEKLDKIVDAVLDNTTKSMPVAQAQEYCMAMDTYGATLLSNYQPGAIEIALSILPYSVIKLYSVLSINARNSTKPFTEEFFRHRIEDCSVSVTRNRRPMWRQLLKVLYENRKRMLELGVDYHVQLAIAAILKVIRDVPRSNNPIFGQTFLATVEAMDERILEVKYDESTKDSHDVTAPWNQQHLADFIRAIAKEEDRLCAYFVEPVDEIPVVCAAEPHQQLPAKEQVCVKHAIGAGGCRFGANECKFLHVDHRALTAPQRTFLRNFVGAHQGPLIIDPKKARAAGVKSSDLSDKLRAVNGDVDLASATVANHTHGGRVKSRRAKERATDDADNAMAVATPDATDDYAAQHTSCPPSKPAPRANPPPWQEAGGASDEAGDWLSSATVKDLLTKEQYDKVARFTGRGDQRAAIAMILLDDE